MRLDSDAIFGRLGEPPHGADFQLVNCDRCGHQDQTLDPPAAAVWKAMAFLANRRVTGAR